MQKAAIGVGWVEKNPSAADFDRQIELSETGIGKRMHALWVCFLFHEQLVYFAFFVELSDTVVIVIAPSVEST